MGGGRLDLVEERLAIAGRDLAILRPRDSEALLDEEAFEHEEFLPYWAELWPSAVALATVLGARDLRGVPVLEIGCGLALPSVVAALGGADVLATDWSPDAVRVAGENARRNGAPIRTAVCSWHEVTIRRPLVIASDVLYERRNADALLDVLPRLVAPGGEALVSDPGRVAAGAFVERAAGYWHLEAVPHEGPEHVVVRRLTRRSA